MSAKRTVKVNTLKQQKHTDTYLKTYNHTQTNYIHIHKATHHKAEPRRTSSGAYTPCPRDRSTRSSARARTGRGPHWAGRRGRRTRPSPE